MLEFFQYSSTGLTVLIERFGLIAVFVLMTLESALIPIPSEVTMPFAGFASSRGFFPFWQVAVIGALGNLVGSLMAYFLGAIMGDSWIKDSIEKWGRFLLITKKDYKKAKKWFIKYGQRVVFTSRLLPVIRTYISLPAGLAKSNIIIFSILTFLGSLIWSIFLAFLGLKLGENWTIVGGYFKRFEIIALALLLILAGVYLLYKVKKGKH